MASNHVSGVKISHVFQVLPSKSSNGFSIPLTYIDMGWFKWGPVERLFFYEIPDLTPPLFFDTIIPKLKTSLSITLSHFIHLAGNVAWPREYERPIILYNPGGSVSLTIAESEYGDDFNHLSGDHVRKAIALQPLVPELSSSETQASGIALQVTLFPHKGLTIGIKFHHSVLDGKSSTMFLKAWAHVFKHMQENQDAVTLPSELTPVFDTKVVKDPEEIDKYVEQMEKLTNRNPKSLKPMADTEDSKGLVRVSFRLSRMDINFLKNLTASWQEKVGKDTLHLSTFVVACAYLVVCLLKTTKNKTKSEENTTFAFAADYRARLDPVVPTNYSGNVTSIGGMACIEDKDLVHEDAVAVIAEKISNTVREIQSRKLLEILMNIGQIDKKLKVISVAGSPKLEVYGTDFGWGKPKKVEVVSIGRDTIPLAEDKDDKGGVEVGLVMDSSEVEKFTSQFRMGLTYSS